MDHSGTNLYVLFAIKKTMPAMYLLTANEKYVLFLSIKMHSFKTEHWSSAFILLNTFWVAEVRKTGFCKSVECFGATACRSALLVLRH
jgi:hypothetical protein